MSEKMCNFVGGYIFFLVRIKKSPGEVNLNLCSPGDEKIMPYINSAPRGKAQVGDHTSGLKCLRSLLMATVSFTNTKIRNYFETPGELAQYQDSNEYFWYFIYGMSVLILKEVRRHPGEEVVFCSHHPRSEGECTAVP
jgi:hypothetical protein